MAMKKSKAELKQEGDAVKAIFATAKKKEQNCAMVLCGDGSLAIEADPRLPTDNLFKKARKRKGATPKGVTGVLKVKGTEMELVLTQEPPGGLETKLKQYLAKIGVKMKPNFILPAEDDGASADGDAAAQEEQAARTATANGQDAEGPSKEQLASDLKHITEIFKLSFGDMDENSAKELKSALKKIAASIASGDLVGAQNMMNQLKLLTGVGPDSPMQAVSLTAFGGAGESNGESKDPAARKKELTAQFQDLKPEIQRSVRISNPAHKAQMENLIKTFGKKMKAGDLEESKAALTAFKDQIESFDKVREEGRSARETKFNAIVAQVQELKGRLERIKAERSAV